MNQALKMQLIFLPEMQQGDETTLEPEARVRRSSNNVLIETLRTGTLGLPQSITRIITVGERGNLRYLGHYVSISSLLRYFRHHDSRSQDPHLDQITTLVFEIHSDTVDAP